METLAVSKVLVVRLCIALLEALPLQTQSMRAIIRDDAVAALEELLREFRRDLTDLELNQVKSGFWRSYQKFMIPRWLHTSYVEILRTNPAEAEQKHDHAE